MFGTYSHYRLTEYWHKSLFLGWDLPNRGQTREFRCEKHRNNGHFSRIWAHFALISVLDRVIRGDISRFLLFEVGGEAVLCLRVSEALIGVDARFTLRLVPRGPPGAYERSEALREAHGCVSFHAST